MNNGEALNMKTYLINNKLPYMIRIYLKGIISISKRGGKIYGGGEINQEPSDWGGGGEGNQAT